MVITVQCLSQRWSVLDAQNRTAETFASGAAAFDAAAAQASAHHQLTGQRSSVRVEALGGAIEALRFGH